MTYIEDGKTDIQFVCSTIKKNIFLIGDSIRMGYCDVTRKALSNVAEVFYVDDNCRNSQYIITSLYSWSNMFSDPACVDVVQFNCGHWDTAHFLHGEFSLTSEGEYARNIQIIISMISKLFPRAKIVFATTTTMNPSGQVGINPRTNEEISHYNDIAKEVANKNDIFVNDLFAITKDWDSSYYRDYCHFNDKSNEILGDGVVVKIKTYI